MDIQTLLTEKAKDFKLKLLVGQGGLNRKISVSALNRPGLAIAGFFEHFPYERIQIIGIIEYTYLQSLSYDKQLDILNKIFSHEKSAGCILTRNLKPTDAMVKIFSDLNIPLLSTELKSSAFIEDMRYYLDGKLAPSISIHAVMINVYGLGVLIVGKSGIGKSECAIELVKRGHKFVADDVVNIRKRSGRILVGSGLEVTKHLMEIRGIGIIDVKKLFGIGNILDESKIELIIELEEWENSKEYERIGLADSYTEYLDVKIPKVVLPVAPGRNLAVLVEIASLNQRFKDKGYFTARDLDDRLQKEINKGSL
ncbi:MAG: HPr(Ser) kinase/phosphatase [Endomicrobium sp.]|jgi:HPr kinase/phosphorylase|uniref:HPr(Ser) kinase/phosphatase n=1 Tax=Candidatus Endomicrobiellum cubanum TaxID=3242325 RepID=UPI00282C0745|nr:HPr(Ser) kinase/phosphatase [Endomicrobium sp.]MDR2395945.1 HPr(Ser) kinase/phosphatase [Endomicrobium sp.]